MKLPIVKHIFVFTTWGQKCPHSEPEQFTFDNFQSNHPVARGDVLHRALLLEAQHSINNNLNLTIVQNMTYRGRQGGTISEVVLDPSDIYEG